MALHRLYSYMVRPSGGTSEVDPPVPIPNTEVKRFSADDTALATVWENKSLPGGLSTTPHTSDTRTLRQIYRYCRYCCGSVVDRRGTLKAAADIPSQSSQRQEAAALTKNSASLNRTLFIADNLDLLESMDNESIDLICIDPPFAKNQTWMGTIRPPLSKEEREQELATLADWGIRNRVDAARAGIEWPDGENGSAKFRDIWRWENDVHEEWVRKIEGGKYEGLARTIEATRLSHGEDTAAYLTYMAIRLIEMHRVLKPTGSLYLHCDPTASHYLKTLMDGIFGRDNFRNEVVWKRQTSNNAVRKKYGAIVDYILFYVKSDDATWNQVYHKRSDVEMKQYRRDASGRLYKTNDLTAPSPTPSRMFEWRGTTPKNRGWRYSLERLEELWAAGRIKADKEGRPLLRGHIQYLDEAAEGQKAQSIWTDILRVGNTAKERTGYPTQKPVALAERIIKASTNPGDIVLDCFAGCAYVPVAAERNGRQWIACDISPRALTVLRRQFAKFRYAINGEQQGDEPALIADADVTVRSPMDLPQRTDEDLDTVDRPKPLPERKFKVPASIIPEREMLEFLLCLSGYMAWCCGFANRMPDGSIVETTNNFHLDHIDPTSKGGSHQITNRAPMCPRHNILKKDRWVHLREYRQEIADAGEMLVNTTDELIDLSMAYEAALVRHAQASEANPSRR